MSETGSPDPRQPEEIRRQLREGLVIPAHPLALTAEGDLDERRQRALTRYYLAAGAGGLAVGVHTTQFGIHDDDIGLYEPVLDLAMAEATRHTGETEDPRPVMIAGLVGDTGQATEEARTARDLGYDCGLLSLAAFPDAPIHELLAHVEAVAAELPVMGFYLQPDVGGRHLPYEFWRQFAEVEDVVGIKIAPFDRYRTLDVVRGVADAGRAGEIPLYTGNDDSIVTDLLTEFPFGGGIPIVGGLLGQWAVWTKTAVDLLAEIKEYRRAGDQIPGELLTRGAELTDANAAIFDAENDHAGCIPGIHEVLRRQGLLEGRRCLDPEETLSPGQLAEIDRVIEAYPGLRDDEFVAAHRAEWLR
ncbi:MAG: dihydrodipicolinate synthase family protein [Halobacteriales archaeon]